MCCLKRVEPSINFGIINSITKLHLVGNSTESSTMHGSMNMKFKVYDSLTQYPFWGGRGLCSSSKIKKKKKDVSEAGSATFDLFSGAYLNKLTVSVVPSN